MENHKQQSDLHKKILDNMEKEALHLENEINNIGQRPSPAKPKPGQRGFIWKLKKFFSGK